MKRYNDDGQITSLVEHQEGEFVRWVDVQARVSELEAQYGELIYAVATKYPDETRHQTALRYIQQAESREASPACELKP